MNVEHAEQSADLLMRQVMGWICDNPNNARRPHVRQAGGWAAVLSQSLAEIGATWRRPGSRFFIEFTFEGRHFKAHFRHPRKRLGRKSQIRIVEIARTPGHPEIREVCVIRNLAEAAYFYAHATALLRGQAAA